MRYIFEIIHFFQNACKCNAIPVKKKLKIACGSKKSVFSELGWVIALLVHNGYGPPYLAS